MSGKEKKYNRVKGFLGCSWVQSKIHDMSLIPLRSRNPELGLKWHYPLTLVLYGLKSILAFFCEFLIMIYIYIYIY